jgi:hypothetical protein
MNTAGKFLIEACLNEESLAFLRGATCREGSAQRKSCGPEAAHPALRVLDEPELHHPARHIGRARLFKVREIYAAGAYATLAARLGPPKAVVGEAVREVATADLLSELRGKARRRWPTSNRNLGRLHRNPHSPRSRRRCPRAARPTAGPTAKASNPPRGARRRSPKGRALGFDRPAKRTTRRCNPLTYIPTGWYLFQHE